MGIVAIALCLFLALGVGVYNMAGKKQPDNAFEEEVEKVIKYETGIDVDLTPGSPEKTG